MEPDIANLFFTSSDFGSCMLVPYQRLSSEARDYQATCIPRGQ